jgi:hypothetical protein
LYRKIPFLDILEHLAIGADLVVPSGGVITLAKDRVLLYTGARGANYVSAAFLRKHEGSFVVRPRANPRVTEMANKTPMRADKVTRLELRFKDGEGRLHTFKGNFLVTENLSMDIIIGLIDIALKIPELFLGLHREGFAKVANKLAHIATLTQPWTTSEEIEAPEEGELPASFPYALRFMEMSHDEALAEYFSLFSTHVEESFLAFLGAL